MLSRKKNYNPKTNIIYDIEKQLNIKLSDVELEITRYLDEINIEGKLLK